jgi:pimeloyl-ACP methyl ester carboxylesterase
MATYVLIHGAASDSWYWHLVVPDLEARGHEVIAPDLPTGDDDAGFEEYAVTVVDALGAVGAADRPAGVRDRVPGDELVVVAQSLGGFTAPLVCEAVPTDLLVLVAAMVPRPGEPPGDWWSNTGWEAQRGERPIDAMEDFFHDVPDDVVAEAMARGETPQSGAVFERPYSLRAWPAVPTRVLAGRHDRFFPIEFMRRVSEERLGIVPDELESGHLPALARPHELVERLEEYRETLRPGRGAG